MQRRGFLTTLLSSAMLANVIRAADVPQDLKVTRAVGFQLPSRRSKVAGKNARLDVHGDRATDRMVRLFTNHGTNSPPTARSSRPKRSTSYKGT